MPSLDEIFYKEFNQMMSQLKGINGYLDLSDIPLPPQASNKFFIEKHNKVYIHGIEDEYYGKLNNTEAMLWGSSALRRRKYDYKGEFIRDKNGNYKIEDVPCPHDCVGVVSDKSIGVPAKYKCKNGSQDVDMLTKGKAAKFVYIIPRRNCYKLNQTALVLSWNKLRVYHSGVSLALTNGHLLYVYIIPYKPTSVVRSYRVLHCKTSDNYSEELTMLRDFWIKNNVIFNPEACKLDEIVRGRDNMAFERLDGVLDTYVRFDTDKSMGDEEELSDLEFEGE